MIRVLRIASLLAAGLLLAGLTFSGSEPVQVRTIPLDIAADFAPLLCGGRLYVFSSGGRNQVMSPDETAPDCDPVHIIPLMQPSCGPTGPVLADRDGNLWQMGKGVPAEVGRLQGPASQLVALLPSRNGTVEVYADRIVLPGTQATPLPLKATSAQRLAHGGFWVWNARSAARLSPQGRLLWTWRPKGEGPGPAVLAGGLVLAGTSSGSLVALSDADGKQRYCYHSGGEIVNPPWVTGKLVIYASLDHLVRALKIRSGQLAWQFRTDGRPSFGPYPVQAGLLFAEDPGQRLFILDPASGREIWNWRVPKGAILKAPAVAGDRAAVLAWSDTPEPTLYLVTLPPKPTPSKAEAPHPAKPSASKRKTPHP
jgi:hypothetical protein